MLVAALSVSLTLSKTSFALDDESKPNPKSKSEPAGAHALTDDEPMMLNHCDVASNVRSESVDAKNGEPEAQWFSSDADATCGQTTREPAYVALIHVGKTGGGTLKGLLTAAGVAFAAIHVGDAHKATDCRFTHYIISTRDPINRTISAFNYNHRAGGEEYSPGIASTRLYTECFPQLPGGVNAFAEALGDASPCGMIARSCLFEPARDCRHLGKGHAYYLQNTGLLEILRRRDKQLLVVRQEAFDSDVAAMWEWLCVKNPPTQNSSVHSYSSARAKDTAISARGLQLLRQHLAMEYHTVEAVQALAREKLTGAPCAGCPPAVDDVGRDINCYAACTTPSQDDRPGTGWK